MGRTESGGQLIWLLAIVAALALPPSIARAQEDDWSISREPRRTEERPRARSRPRPRRRAAQPEATTTPPVATEESGDERAQVLIERYRRIALASPEDGFALERLLALYRERDGRIDGLLDEMRAAAADASAYAPRMIAGHIERRRGHLAEARALYEEALALRPDDPLPRASLSRVATESGELALARTRLDEAIERTPAGAARDLLLRQAADLALDAQDYAAAERLFETLARAGGAYLRTEYARALAQRGEHERAITAFEEAARALSGDRRVLAPVLVELARAQLAAARVDDAIATLERADRVAGAEAGARGELAELTLDAYRQGSRLPELRDRLARRAGGADGALLYARVLDELGEVDAALVAYRRALASRARDVDTRLRVIQLLTRSGRLEEVVAEQRALVRAQPREPRFLVELATLLTQLGRRDEAHTELARASRASREPALHRALAQLYARWGDAELAEAELTRLVALEPSDPTHLVALGEEQLSAGRRDEALATWRRILDAPGDRAGAHATLGAILADHDVLDAAIVEYREAVRLAPESLDHLRGLASTLERAGQDAEAETLWAQVLERSGDDRAARREAREHVVAVWARGRTATSRAAQLERLFSGEQPDVEAGRMLAEVLRRTGDLGGAERVLSRVVELAPGDVDSLTTLERIRSQRGDRDGAIQALARLVEAEPHRAAQHLARMAEHAHALYRDDEALRYASDAVARSPDDAAAHRRLGDLLRARQDLSAAIASYRRALELNDRLLDTAFDLAELYVARGELREADAVYRRIVAAAPDDDLVLRAARASLQLELGLGQGAGDTGALERELLPLALAHPERSAFRRAVVELYDVSTVSLLAASRRGGEAGADARAALARIGGRALDPLLEALADDDPAQRRVALSLLGALGNRAAAAPLLALAEDGAASAEERAQATLAAAELVAVGAPELALVQRLAQLAQPGGEARLRAAATWSLAARGGEPALAALRSLLRDDDASVRGLAALGLGAHRDRASLATMRELLASDARPDAQAGLALGLGLAADEASEAALVGLARSGPSRVAVASLLALGALGSEMATRTLLTALYAADSEQRAAAASALAASGALELAPVRLGEGTASYVRRLGERRPQAGPLQLDRHASLLAEVLAGLLSSPSGTARAALETLTSHEAALHLPIGDRDARAEVERALVPALVSLLVPADPALRVLVVRALGRVDDPRAELALVGALEDAEPIVLRAALESLATLPSPTSLSAPPLARLATTHASWEMRMRATRALGRVPADDAVLGALLAALRSDPYAFVREAALAPLAAIDAPAAREALARACTEDEEPRVRARAAELAGGACGDLP